MDPPARSDERPRKVTAGLLRVLNVTTGRHITLGVRTPQPVVAFACRKPGTMYQQSRKDVMPLEDIVRTIVILRGQRVLLDTELAALYGVTTRRLNEQVRRNRSRFPADFLFELTAEEFSNLKSHFATSSWGGRRLGLGPANRPHG
jgi:ORF6N domain